MAEINETPSGMRTHIGFFGKTNSGKSTLINALVGQEVSIVSPEPGTTTDPVYKAIEIAPIGPCLLIDTSGLEDETTLGSVREAKTRQVAEMCDVAVVVSVTEDNDTDRNLLSFFKKKNVPVFCNTGCRLDTIERILSIADGACVGTALKGDDGRVDVDKVRAFMEAARRARRDC